MRLCATAPPALPHSHLLEAPHAVQDVELLPALGEVHFAVNVIRVPQVDKGQVLQDQASAGEKGAAGQGEGKQGQRLVTQGQHRQPNTRQANEPPTAATTSMATWD